MKKKLRKSSSARNRITYFILQKLSKSSAEVFLAQKEISNKMLYYSSKRNDFFK